MLGVWEKLSEMDNPTFSHFESGGYNVSYNNPNLSAKILINYEISGPEVFLLLCWNTLSDLPGTFDTERVF